MVFHVTALLTLNLSLFQVRRFASHAAASSKLSPSLPQAIGLELGFGLVRRVMIVRHLIDGNLIERDGMGICWRREDWRKTGFEAVIRMRWDVIHSRSHDIQPSAHLLNLQRTETGKLHQASQRSDGEEEMHYHPSGACQ